MFRAVMCTMHPHMAQKLQILIGQLGQISAQLREVLAMEPQSQVVMDCAILRFELAYEVLCKTLQAHANWQGTRVQSPREALKHGFRSDFFTDWDAAEDIISDRNLLTHTYDLESARRVHGKLPVYLKFIEGVLAAMQKDVS